MRSPLTLGVGDLCLLFSLDQSVERLINNFLREPALVSVTFSVVSLFSVSLVSAVIFYFLSVGLGFN